MSDTPIVNFNIQRGDDDDKIISFWTEAGAPVPLSELSEIRFTMREDWATSEADDSTAIFSAALGAGLVPFDANSVLMPLPSSSTVTWLFARYVHDVQVLTTSGKRITTQKGAVQLRPDVGRG